MKTNYIKAVLQIIGLTLFISYMAYKTFSSHELYKISDEEFQLKMKSEINLIVTENRSLSTDQLAQLLMATTDRQLEHLYISWLNKYLIVFMSLFAVSTVGLIINTSKSGKIKQLNNNQEKT